MIFNERRARIQPGPPLAGYPAWARSLIEWFDNLTGLSRSGTVAADDLFEHMPGALLDRLDD